MDDAVKPIHIDAGPSRRSWAAVAASDSRPPAFCARTVSASSGSVTVMFEMPAPTPHTVLPAKLPRSSTPPSSTRLRYSYA